MRTKHTLVLFFESKGMKLKTWAVSMGFSSKDTQCLYDLAVGKTQGLRGRSKELKELLKKHGFGEGLKRVEQSRTDSANELKKGA